MMSCKHRVGKGARDECQCDYKERKEEAAEEEVVVGWAEQG